MCILGLCICNTIHYNLAQLQAVWIFLLGQIVCILRKYSFKKHHYCLNFTSVSGTKSSVQDNDVVYHVMISRLNILWRMINCWLKTFQLGIVHPILIILAKHEHWYIKKLILFSYCLKLWGKRGKNTLKVALVANYSMTSTCCLR